MKLQCVTESPPGGSAEECASPLDFLLWVNMSSIKLGVHSTIFVKTGTFACLFCQHCRLRPETGTRFEIFKSWLLWQKIIRMGILGSFRIINIMEENIEIFSKPSKYLPNFPDTRRLSAQVRLSLVRPPKNCSWLVICWNIWLIFWNDTGDILYLSLAVTQSLSYCTMNTKANSQMYISNTDDKHRSVYTRRWAKHATSTAWKFLRQISVVAMTHFLNHQTVETRTRLQFYILHVFKCDMKTSNNKLIKLCSVDPA